MKKLAALTAIFIVGALGGAFGDRVLFSYLAGKAPFSEIRFIRDAGRGTTIINRTEQVVVRENERLNESVAKATPFVVGVRSIAGDTVYQGTGIILTSDGLVITSGDLLLSGALNEVVRGDTRFTATVVMRDPVSGIAVLKIDAGNLPVVTFAEEVKLGESVFLVGVETEKDASTFYVETGAVRKVAGGSFETTIGDLKFSASGSPLFNLEQKVAGITLVRKGVASVVPARIIGEVFVRATQK